jgi:hypothetical protein
MQGITAKGSRRRSASATLLAKLQQYFVVLHAV